MCITILSALPAHLLDTFNSPAWLSWTLGIVTWLFLAGIPKGGFGHTYLILALPSKAPMCRIFQQRFMLLPGWNGPTRLLQSSKRTTDVQPLPTAMPGMGLPQLAAHSWTSNFSCSRLFLSVSFLFS